ncbi:MAG: hypothetical protein CVV02_17295 [Firmicutes bacterium HGW-Firmicutes-7]|nr:MAG: hypothetical protein CVV02_17295 [Firmicutes bacterium HGW-Firmicutes-7]
MKQAIKQLNTIGGNGNMKKAKRVTALFTAFVLAFSTLISTVSFAAVNEDVAGTDYEVAVSKLKAIGVMEGYPDGSFQPEGEITRAEFAKIAVVAMGLGDAANASKGNTKFPDVNGTHWASGYINLAVNTGLLKGYPDGTYKPENKMTNAEGISILVRMAGLGPVVDKEGTWPANYVGRAANEGILKGVNVTSDTKAIRGIVSKMLVNTLTVNLWGANGYANDGSVQYGPLNKTLLTDTLKVTELKKETVTGYDVDDNSLTLAGDVNDTFELASNVDVDLYAAYMNTVTAWVNDDDEIILIDITSKSFIDAIDLDLGADKEVELIGLDKKYDLSAALLADVADFTDENGAGSAVTGKYPLAKIVLNDKNEVAYIDAYELTDMVVVESVNGDIVTTIDEDEFDLDDYTIFKAGKLIATTDMVKGDILTFNTTTEIAEVYTKSVSGSIENIYSDAFEVNDVVYEYAAGLTIAKDAMYMDEDDNFVEFDSDAADKMEDEGDVTLFLDRTGEALFVTGELGELETNKVAGVLINNAAFDTTFGKVYAQFNFINQEGNKVTTNLKVEDLEKINGTDVKKDTFAIVGADVIGTDTDANGTEDILAADVTADTLIEFVYNSDGNIVELNFLDSDVVPASTETDAKYIAGNMVKSDTLVFVIESLNGATAIEAKDVTVVQWSKITAFDTFAAGTIYTNDKSEVLYIVVDADDVNLDADTTDVTGLLVSSRTNTDGDVTRATAWVNGVEKTYTVNKVTVALTPGKAYTLSVDDATGNVTDIAPVVVAASELDEEVATVNTSNRTFTVTGNAVAYKLVSDAVIIDRTGSVNNIKVKTTTDLKKLIAGNQVTIILDEAGTQFVKMVIITDNGTDGGVY